MKYVTIILFFLLSYTIVAQNNLNKNSLNLIKYNLVNSDSIAANKINDSLPFVVPQFKQGFFCNFEDNIQKKKVPLNFQLGNSKY